MLAVGRPGRLAFVRSIGVGTESFADALVRPLRARAAETAPVSLDRESVRSVLRQVGIPSPDALIPGHPELTGASLLPVLHPVIQRLALEIKQSVRFGVEDADTGTRVLAGDAYVAAASYAPVFAIAGSLMAVIQLATYVDVARARHVLGLVAWAGAAVLAALIYWVAPHTIAGAIWTTIIVLGVVALAGILSMRERSSAT